MDLQDPCYSKEELQREAVSEAQAQVEPSAMLSECSGSSGDAKCSASGKSSSPETAETSDSGPRSPVTHLVRSFMNSMVYQPHHRIIKSNQTISELRLENDDLFHKAITPINHVIEREMFYREVPANEFQQASYRLSKLETHSQIPGMNGESSKAISSASYSSFALLLNS
ncbi:hypothetical protein Cgig2_013702 [Carnegiea gigantea]|uniref:Uncharacterized protein n=1 Tax=Carnegiea gigantea TaxID=171969 RepID=A0A9Q1GGW3_9CARY|nr:hypothetical protein Cgig2_013702 [Carnegiea gigantea]